jgi:predicted GIY-YIG superfamily endonuclease
MESRQLLLLPPVRPLSERLGPEFFRAIPERPGVYFLCGPGDGVLYVGKAKNLRRRLGSYRSAHTDRVPRKIGRLLAAVVRIHWDECPDESSALARERELIGTLRPRFNTAGVRPAPRLALGWNAGPGVLDLAIGDAAEGMPRLSGPLRGAPALHAPLLRLAWGAAHPSLPLTELPTPLRGRRAPANVRLPLAFPDLDGLLAGFLDGSCAELPERLVALRRESHPFGVSWQRRDVERLAEAHAVFAVGRESADAVGGAP